MPHLMSPGLGTEIITLGTGGFEKGDAGIVDGQSVGLQSSPSQIGGQKAPAGF
jgi:hypothetical protein